ncbi:WG repeat-containing protein [Flavisolibacter tropicus]|uniref:WG repeat-containing protein n=1 Tax=Flavisolibacter tropicus TaxID=1492898 RepID=A0A172TZC3_9BACT|nr:WG repeat-containing protein [Flavisolibacter tropicus]ANE52410.1 hypothetical protein SY85_19900 [Flavisolibacter tropicus]
MKQTALFLFQFLLLHFSFGQSQDSWVRFYDTASEKSGYKDLKGNIKIPATFDGLTKADTFYHIIAVNEMAGDTYKSYYLLKDGRKVGQDSVYVFDFMFDCESEGKIIFYDRKKDRVGFLNQDGVAIIPAVYNYVSPFRNGLAIAHRNAKRKCWDKGGDTTNCEHLGWEGGESILINDKNEILVDSFAIDLSSIDWYSRKINDPSVDTSLYISIKGRGNTTYSFVDYDKEFKKWFYNTFLSTVRSKNKALSKLLFDEVTYWSGKKGWTSIGRTEFLKTFPAVLTAQRFEAGKLKEISLSQDMFNDLIFDKSIYKKYLNACGAHNKDQYPLYNVMLTYYKKRLKPLTAIESGFLRNYEIDYQEHFEFLRTENGYKLLSVSLKK